MANIVEDWIVSFGSGDWRENGSLYLYAPSQKKIRRSVERLSQKKVIRKLENCLKHIAHVHDLLMKHKENPHTNLFLSVLYIIMKMDIKHMSHVLAKACLVLLLFLQGPFHITLGRDPSYLDDALFFLDGLGNETTLYKSQPHTQDCLLTGLSWNILHEPWRAYNRVGKEKQPVNFSERLFDCGASLIVSDRYSEREAEIIVSGTTVYDTLKTIHDFYVRAEAKYYETHDDDHDWMDSHEEDVEEYGWYVGDGKWFEGLIRTDGGSWYVDKGS